MTNEATTSGINYSIQTKQGLRNNLSFKREKFKEIIPKDANSITWKKSLKKRSGLSKQKSSINCELW